MIATLVSIRLKVATALSEIVIGTLAQLVIGAALGAHFLGTDDGWIKFLASIGAVLLMELSQKAAKYMPECEIIELHHDQKLDAPSGTALQTAEMIREVRKSMKQGHPDEK